MSRRRWRNLSLVFLFALAGLSIYVGSSVPGYLMLAAGLAGLGGLNIWYNGPLDPRYDKPASPKNGTTLSNVEQRGCDTFGDLCVRQEWIQEGRVISAQVATGRTVQVKLPTVKHGTVLRLKGQSLVGGGNLLLRICIIK